MRRSMHSREGVLVLLMLPLIISACGGSSSDIPFAEVQYVRSFPETYDAGEGRRINVGKVGICDIMLLDEDMLLVSTMNPDGYISAYRLSDGVRSADFFRKGNGPGELLSTPYFGSMSLELTQNGRNLIFGNRKGRLLRWKTQNIINDTQPVLESVCDSIPSEMLELLYIGKDRVLCKTIGNDMDSWKRYLLSKDGISVAPPLEKLNALCIPVKDDGYLFNTLSTFWRYNSDKDIVVEASIMLNTIHMYRLDGSFEKTICIGKKAVDIEDLCSDIEGAIETFVRLMTYDDFFAVMYSGAKQYPGPTDIVPNSKIFLFDWAGKPLVEIDLPKKASVFDMDLENGLLYTLNRDDESVYCYDVPELKNM